MAYSVRCLAINLHTTIEWLKGKHPAILRRSASLGSSVHTFDDKRQFLGDFVERVVNDRYRVQVIGAVSVKTQNQDLQEIEMRELSFCLRREIDRSTLHKKPRKKFAEACRLRFLNRNGSRSYGASGRVMNGAHRSLTSGVRPPAATQSRRNSKDFLGFRSCVLRST